MQCSIDHGEMESAPRPQWVKLAWIRFPSDMPTLACYPASKSQPPTLTGKRVPPLSPMRRRSHEVADDAASLRSRSAVER